MLRNYLTIAYRTLKRRPGYAAINVTGLAVGMACCLLIVLYVQEELSYDDFHEKAERTYAIGWKTLNGTPFLVTPYPLAAALEAKIPEVTEATRLIDTDPLLLSHDGETFQKVEEGLFVEPAFFDVFSFDLQRSSPQQALAEPNSIVLTQSAARRLFGKEDPLGQTLYWHQPSYWQRFDTTLVLEVAGIAADPPPNTSLPFGALISLSTKVQSQSGPTIWNASMYRTFVVLAQEEDVRALPAHLSALVKAHYESEGGSSYEFFPVPLTSLHLSDLVTKGGFTGKRLYLYLFSAIALIILLIACINYINLATARAAQRAKEVGVRKTAGATRFQLTRQFLGESVLLALGALVLAVLLVETVVPAFNGTFGTHLELAYSENVLFLGTLIGMVVIVGLAAGSYPALVLSAFEPTQVLKGRTRRGRSDSWLRKGLVVVQFTLSTALLVGTFTIYRQLQFVQSKELGFDGEQVVVVELPGEQAWRLREALRREVLAHPGIIEAATATAAPGGFGIEMTDKAEEISPEAQVAPEQSIRFSAAVVDYHYLETLNIKLVAGHDFSSKYPSDRERAYIINEAAARALGWTPEEAVRKPFNLYSHAPGEVIGVVADFHLESLHDRIGPVVLQLHESDAWSAPGDLIARLAPGRIRLAMDHIEEQLARYALGAPFEYQFLDDIFDAMYRTERRLGRVFMAVAAVAVLLACLGLFGLAAYAAERRTKEIGIRKVLGASVPSIVALLSKDFLKLVLVAFVIATPLAYYAMRRWLQDFAYHIEIGPWLFVGAGLVALVIALAAVSYQAIRAALADPVDALRYE